LVLLVGQSVGKPTPQLSLRAGSNRASQPFDRRHRWADDAPVAQFLKQSSNQRRSMIGGERRRQQPRCELPIQSAGEWAQPQGSFNLKDVLPASLIALGVIAELRSIEF
jgi:hypothetical protein